MNTDYLAWLALCDRYRQRASRTDVGLKALEEAIRELEARLWPRKVGEESGGCPACRSPRAISLAQVVNRSYLSIGRAG